MPVAFLHHNTRKLLRQIHCIQTSLSPQNSYIKQLLHKQPFTPNSFCTLVTLQAFCRDFAPQRCTSCFLHQILLHHTTPLPAILMVIYLKSCDGWSSIMNVFQEPFAALSGQVKLWFLVFAAIRRWKSRWRPVSWLIVLASSVTPLSWKVIRSSVLWKSTEIQSIWFGDFNHTIQLTSTWNQGLEYMGHEVLEAFESRIGDHPFAPCFSKVLPFASLTESIEWDGTPSLHTTAMYLWIAYQCERFTIRESTWVHIDMYHICISFHSISYIHASSVNILCWFLET